MQKRTLAWPLGSTRANERCKCRPSRRVGTTTVMRRQQATGFLEGGNFGCEGRFQGRLKRAEMDFAWRWRKNC